MAATDRVVAAGTRLFAKVNVESVYSQVAGVVSISGPDQTADSIDVTELDPYEGSTTLPANPEFHKLFTAGWRDNGSVTLLLNLTQANFIRLNTQYNQGTTGAFYIELRNGVQRPFNAFVTAVGQTSEKDGLIQLNVTFKITGKLGLTTLSA
jgi:hypothetical protein